jgi:hypothetical protein
MNRHRYSGSEFDDLLDESIIESYEDVNYINKKRNLLKKKTYKYNKNNKHNKDNKHKKYDSNTQNKIKVGKHNKHDTRNMTECFGISPDTKKKSKHTSSFSKPSFNIKPKENKKKKKYKYKYISSDSTNISQILNDKKIKYHSSCQNSDTVMTDKSTDISIKDLIPENMLSLIVMGCMYYIFSHYGSGFIYNLFGSSATQQIIQPKIESGIYSTINSFGGRQHDIIELVTSKIIKKIGGTCERNNHEFIRQQVRNYIMNTL